MGDLDDEFEAIIEHSDMEDLGSHYSSFSVEYLVSSIAHLTRTNAILSDLLQASFEHYSQNRPDAERPGLTADQVEYLVAVFENSAKFNLSVLEIQEATDDDDD
jgi:hypothetical protein